MRYGGSNPPLCTIFPRLCFRQKEFGCMNPSGTGRMVVALAAIALLAVLVWRTMEPGKFQSLTWILLGFFAFRVILGWMRSR